MDLLDRDGQFGDQTGAHSVIVVGMDEQTLRHTFDERYGSLVGLARLLLDDRGQAEAVVREAFARTLAGSAPDVRRGVVDLTRNRLRRFVIGRIDGGRGSEAVVLDPGRRDVIDAVGALPRLQLECVVLTSFDACTTEELADALGISPDAATSHLEKARASLSERLEGGIDERLTDALAEQAGSAEASPDSWQAVLDASTAVGVRRRRRFIVAGVALIALVAGAVGVITLTDIGPAPGERLGLQGPADPPASIVVVAGPGEIRIIDTADGHITKVVRKGIEPSLAPIVAAPDGNYAYVDQPAEGDCDEARQIERVSLPSGTSETVADGRSPTISHRGAHLAYVEASDPRACDKFDTLVIRTRADQTEQRWPSTQADAHWGITYLHWSADDRLLGFMLLESNGFSIREFDLSVPDGTRLDESRIVTLPDGDLPVGYLADDRILGLHTTSGGSAEFYAVDPDGTRHPLITRQKAFIDIGAVAIDATGTHILWIEQASRQRGEARPGRLMRLRVGAAAPVRVADGIVSASWLEQANDAALAAEVLHRAFRTDVRPLVAEARLRNGAEGDPLAVYRPSGYRAATGL
jgi:DNA-directed RNA polymerase specialized sigma24 family protein